MQTAAIYVRDPLPTPGSIISNEAQERARREYCLAKNLTVLATLRDTAGSRDEFTRMISEATLDDSILDLIVGLEARPLLHVPGGDHRAGTRSEELAPDWSRPRRKGSTTSRPLYFISEHPAIQHPQSGVPTAKSLPFLEAS